jgi:hypothetical protein
MYRPIKAVQFGGFNSSASPDLLKETDFRELINWRQVKQGKLVTRDGVAIGVHINTQELLDTTGGGPGDPYPYDPKKVVSLAEGIIGIGELVLPSKDHDADTDRYMVYAIKLKGELKQELIGEREEDSILEADREWRAAFIMVPLSGTHRDTYVLEEFYDIPPLQIDTQIAMYPGGNEVVLGLSTYFRTGADKPWEVGEMYRLFVSNEGTSITVLGSSLGIPDGIYAYQVDGNGAVVPHTFIAVPNSGNTPIVIFNSTLGAPVQAVLWKREEIPQQDTRFPLGFSPTFFSALPHVHANRAVDDETKEEGYRPENKPSMPTDAMSAIKLMSDDGHFLQMNMYANKLVISDPINGDMLLQWRDLREDRQEDREYTYALTVNTIDRFDVGIVEIDNEVASKNQEVENGMALYKYKLKEAFYEHTEDNFNNKFGFIFGTNLYDGFGLGETIDQLDPNAGTKDAINKVASAAGVIGALAGVPYAIEAAQVLSALISWAVGDGPDMIDSKQSMPSGIASIRERAESIFKSKEHLAMFSAAIYSRIPLRRLEQSGTVKYIHRGHRYSHQGRAQAMLVDIMKDSNKKYRFTNALLNAYRYDDLTGGLEFAYDEFNRTFIDDDGVQRTEFVREKSADVYVWDDYKIKYYPCSGKKRQSIGYQYIYPSDMDFDKTTPLVPRVVAFDKATGFSIDVPVGVWQYRFVWDYGNNEFSAPSTPVTIPDMLFSAVKDALTSDNHVEVDRYTEYFDAVERQWVAKAPQAVPKPDGYDDYIFQWSVWYSQAYNEGYNEASVGISEPNPPSYEEPLTSLQQAELYAYGYGYNDGQWDYGQEQYSGYSPLEFDIAPRWFPEELQWEPIVDPPPAYPEVPYVDGVQTAIEYRRFINPHEDNIYSKHYSILNDLLLFNSSYNMRKIGDLFFDLKQRVYSPVHRFNPVILPGTYDPEDSVAAAARFAMAKEYADYATMITLRVEADEMPLNGTIMAGVDLDFWDSSNIQPYRAPLVVPIFPTSGSGLNSIATKEGRLRVPFCRTDLPNLVNTDGERVNWDYVRPNKMLVFSGLNTVFDRNRGYQTPTGRPATYWLGSESDPWTSEYAMLQALTGEQKIYLNFLRLDYSFGAGNNNAFPFDRFGQLIPTKQTASYSAVVPSALKMTTDDNNTNSDWYDVAGHTVYDTYIRVVKSISDEMSVVKDDVPSDVVDRLVLSGVMKIPLVYTGERLFYNTEYRMNPPSWVNENGERKGDMRLIRTGMPYTNGMLGRSAYTNCAEDSNSRDLRGPGAYNDKEEVKLFAGTPSSDIEDISKEEVVENLEASIYLKGERFIGVEQLTSYFPGSLLFKSPRFSLSIKTKDIPKRAKRVMVFRTLSSLDNSYQPNRFGQVVSLKIERSTGELPYAKENGDIFPKGEPVYFDEATSSYKEGIYFFDDVRDDNLNFTDDINRYEGLTEPLKSNYNISLDNRMVFANYTETYQPPTPRGGKV